MDRDERKRWDRKAGLGRRLAAYAAGSAVAMGAGDAAASVIYTGPLDVTLDQHGATFDLDFNGDSVTEFEFRKWHYSSSSSDDRGAGLYPSAGAVPLVFEDVSGNPTNISRALDAGQTIGPGAPFGADTFDWLGSYSRFYSEFSMSAPGSWVTNTFGDFVGVNSKFLGVRFDLIDGTHYGWVQLSADDQVNFLRIEGWAWETQPDKAIAAGQTVPEPSSLSLLALGVVGSMGLAWGRDRRPESNA